MVAPARNPLLEGWEPTGPQLKVLQDESRRVLLIAGNRFGKTSLGMRRVLHCARGDYPWAPLKDGSHYWVLTPSEKSFEEVHWPIFQEWCPKDWLVHWNQGRYRATIERLDGSHATISWMSYEQSSQKLIGASLAGAWFDEPPPRAHYQEVRARLVDQSGWMWITMTPVDGMGWWGNEIYVPAKEGRNRWSLHQCALAERDPDNPKEFYVGRPLVVHLTREMIVEFASDFPDEDDLAIRIFGEVRSRRGLVYKGWDPAMHVVDAFEPPRTWDIWGAIDPGYHGFAVVLGAVTPTNEIVVLREYFSQGQALATRFSVVEQLVRDLRPRMEDWAYQYEDLLDDSGVEAARRMHDGAADVTLVFYVDTEDPQTILELNNASLASVALQRARGEPMVIGLTFTPIEQGLKAVKAGILRVQRLLHPVPGRPAPGAIDRDSPLDDPAEPRLYVFRDLMSDWRSAERRHQQSRLMWEFDNYEWKPPPRDTTMKIDEPAKESADGAHMLDALRYLVMARVGPRTYVDPRLDPQFDPFDIGGNIPGVEFARAEEAELKRHMWNRIRSANQAAYR